MGKFSLFTGADKTAEGYQPPFKKMCLNCIFCAVDGNADEESGGTTPMICVNEKVLEAGKKKITESLANQDFEVLLDVRYMRLKDITKKCKQHQTNMDGLIKELEETFATL